MKNLKKLLSYIKGYEFLYFIALIFLILSQIAVALQPQLIKITIDSAINGKALDTDLLSSIVSFFESDLHGKKGLIIMGAFILALAIIRGVFTFLRISISNVATSSAMKRLRDKLYNHIQLLPYSYHTSSSTGDLIQRCTSDVQTVGMAFTQILDAFSATFLIVYSVYLMSKLNTSLMLISLALMPIILTASAIFSKKMQNKFQDASETEAKMTSVMQENLTGIRVVKAFSRHDYEIEKFRKISELYRDKNIRINTNYAEFWTFMDMISIIQVMTILLYGGLLAYRDVISLGDLVAFLSYTAILTQPLKHLGRIITSIARACVAAGRVEKILQEKPEDIHPTKAEPNLDGDIIFDNVSFSYPNSENLVLDSVSFKIEKGQTLAILGHTGSGKSSLMHLLARLYDCNNDSGSITINGENIRQLDKAWVRKNIGLVLQEPYLYSKTIMENIKLAHPEIDDEEAIYYSKIAAMDEEIKNFDEGYESMVGEKGVSLSGGQRQRLAIARTLIKKAPILIFDDSLSAVDTKTDIAIRKALNAEKKNKTTIIISHRISTVQDADKIIVLEDGKIVQQGKHKELVQDTNGIYYRLYQIQCSIN